MIGWGIGIVFAFVVGMIVGAGGLAAFALSKALKLRAAAGTDTRTHEELNQKIIESVERIRKRSRELKKLQKEISTLKKRAPRSIPIIHRAKCQNCGRTNESKMDLDHCPLCGGDLTKIGAKTSTPFLGEPS